MWIISGIIFAGIVATIAFVLNKRLSKKEVEPKEEPEVYKDENYYIRLVDTNITEGYNLTKYRHNSCHNQLELNYRGLKVTLKIGEDIMYSYRELEYSLLVQVSETQETHTLVENLSIRTEFSINNALQRLFMNLDTYISKDGLFEDAKKEYRDIITLEEVGKFKINYNNLPIVIKNSLKVFDRSSKLESYYGSTRKIIKSISMDYMDYPYSNNTKPRVVEELVGRGYTANTLKELADNLETIENDLLYDLSNFTDAFRSMLGVSINGYKLDIDSFKVDEQYHMYFNYVSEMNTLHFKIEPFNRIMYYSKNSLKDRQKNFETYTHALNIIKEVLEESKRMVPFETECMPEMVYNNSTGQLEIDTRNALPFKED